MNLYKKLVAYNESDYYGFHMPGHKRNQDKTGCHLPYGLDITEIDGFDDLHHAKGILKEAQTRASNLYGGDESFFLVNGSTSGILSAVLGCTLRGDAILVGRNCHKSVYHSIYMNELRPVYLFPQFVSGIELNGPISVADVRQSLREHPDIRAVVITSPTYDGVISDVKGIAEVVHESGIPLIVDEAHGAHLGFHPYFPENSNRLGADVVIHSLHKTLPALTQTALLHMNGNLVDRQSIQLYLHMMQTSSPSYVLMASMDVCLEGIEEKGSGYFGPYVEMLERARRELKDLRYLELVETDFYDKSKMVISVKNSRFSDSKTRGLLSSQLYDILLKKYHLQMEMKAGSYVLAMTSVADTEEGMQRLVKALLEIDCEMEKLEVQSSLTGTAKDVHFELPKLNQKYTVAEVENMRRTLPGKQEKGIPEIIFGKSWKECVGYVSSEYAYVYPPGIPLIVPGEIISGEVCGLLEMYKTLGFSIEGLKKEEEIEVLING